MVLPGRKYTAYDIGRVVLDRWWAVILGLAVGTAAGVFIYKRLPVRYRSETLIMVVPQRIPDSYVKSTVTLSVEDRLRSITEQILSRSRLQRIIRDFNLYQKERASGIMEDVIQRMANDIAIKLEGKESSFRVAYVNSDPKTAQQVTERLATLFIDENLRDRENLADNTNVFLESQLEDAKRRLIEQEKKLEAYRRQYAGQLPSQLTGNLQVIQNAQMQLQSLNESMNRARERHLLIERQIADVETFRADVLPGVAAAVPPDGTAATAEVPVRQRLDAARLRLEAAKLRYTSDHPDVVTLTQVVRDLETKVKEEAAIQPEPTTEKPSPRAEAARQKRLSELRAELAVVDHQLGAAESEESRLKRTIADYQAKVESLPTRESDLVDLTRDYSTLQTAYSSLLLKQEESKLAANLERRQIGEQFKILDGASSPERPYNQRERVAALAGLPLAGVALGLLLIAILEFNDSSFRCEDEVARAISAPVLALIPIMDSKSGGDRRTRTGRL